MGAQAMSRVADADARPLPLDLEDVDAVWLTRALSGYAPGIEVRSFEIVDVRNGFTTIVRLRLDMNEAGHARLPETVMLKGGFEPHSRARARTYVMEAVGYRDVWPVIGLRTPVCYFVDAEPERQQAIMIMEDLRARGVTFCHALVPQSFEQVQRRLSALAEAHAKTWDSPDLQPGGRWDIVVRNGARMMRMHFDAVGFSSDEGWQAFLDMPRGAAASKIFHDKDWACRSLEYLAKISDEIPNCVIHGDTHLGNLYDDIDGEPGFFDSIPRREPGYFELAYTIACGLDVVDRRHYEHVLIRHYVQELRRFGVEISIEDATLYYRLFLFQGYIFFFINETQFQTEAFNTIHTARYSAAMIDNGTKQLFDALMGV